MKSFGYRIGVAGATFGLEFVTSNERTVWEPLIYSPLAVAAGALVANRKSANTRDPEILGVACCVGFVGALLIDEPLDDNSGLWLLSVPLAVFFSAVAWPINDLLRWLLLRRRGRDGQRV